MRDAPNLLATCSRLASVPSPNGVQEDSPGQRPGFTGPKHFKPCKGETKPAHRPRQSKTGIVPPFQGLGICGGRQPRASLRFALGYYLSPFQGWGWLPLAHALPPFLKSTVRLVVAAAQTTLASDPRDSNDGRVLTPRTPFPPGAGGRVAAAAQRAPVKDAKDFNDDGLYTWAKDLYREKHTQAPVEQLLLEVYHKYLKQGSTRKAPAWTKELKEMIQDQLDTNMALSLQQVSDELEINPAYLSREFSKYFENLSFGEYIRKMRIEKAIHLMETTNYSLTEIAYLTGFSDQSHFNRIFKKQTGQNPSLFKKQNLKSKKDTNS